MAREKTWLRTEGQFYGLYPWWPLIVPLVIGGPGTTLLRTRIDLLIELNAYNDGSGLSNFPEPWLGIQTVAAVAGPTADAAYGFFGYETQDWLWVNMVAWDMRYYTNSLAIDAPPEMTYSINTIETRHIDTKSQRLVTEEGTSAITLVVDAFNYLGAEQSQFMPQITWVASLLVEGPNT
jgi:hypothetical protein